MLTWLDEEEQRAWRALWSVASRLPAYLNQGLQADAGLSIADYDVLVPLSEEPAGRLRMYHLADQLGWERSRLSHQLSRMEHRGLVNREECRDDRRGAYVAITAPGREAITAAAPGHVAAVRRAVFDGLSAGQVKALRRTAETVLDHLGSSGPAPRE